MRVDIDRLQEETFGAFGPLHLEPRDILCAASGVVWVPRLVQPGDSLSKTSLAVPVLVRCTKYGVVTPQLASIMHLVLQMRPQITQFVFPELA